MNNTVWSKTLLTVYPYLPKAVKTAEEKIKGYPFTNAAISQDALHACKAILQLTNHKNDLINAKILVDRILDKLDKPKRDFLTEKYIKHQSVEIAADELGISRATAFRRHADSIREFSFILEQMGYDADTLRETYEYHPFLSNAYRIINENERNVGKISV